VAKNRIFNRKYITVIVPATWQAKRIPCVAPSSLAKTLYAKYIHVDLVQ